jgi:hypothetical protein
MTDIQPILNIPSGANIKQSGTYPILAGYKTITPTNYQTTQVPGFQGTLGFNITPPSPETALSRQLYVLAQIELTITHNVPADKMPKRSCMWTEYDAIRAFPLNRCTVSTQVVINDGTFSNVTNRVLEPLLRCNTTAAEWAGLSGTTTQLDMQSDYLQGSAPKNAIPQSSFPDPDVDANLAFNRNDPFMGWVGTSSDRKYMQMSQFAAHLTKQHEDAGSNKTFSLDSIKYPAFNQSVITFTTREPLFIPPFNAQVCGEEYAIRGVSTLAINMILDNPNQIHQHDTSEWIAAAGTATTSNYAASAFAKESTYDGGSSDSNLYYSSKISYPPEGYIVKYAGGPVTGVTSHITYSAKFTDKNPSIECTWYTMPDAKAYLPDTKLFYSSYRVDPYTDISSVLQGPRTVRGLNNEDVGSQMDFVSQNIQFGNIPQRIIVVMQPKYQNIATTRSIPTDGGDETKARQLSSGYELGVAERTNNFGVIDRIEIEYDVQSGILSGASSFQLWQRSYANGYRGTYLDWTKGFGSVLILDVGKDLPMMNQSEPPGARITKNFKIRVFGHNQSCLSDRNYSLSIFTISSGIMTIQNQGTSVNNAPVTSQAITEAWAGSQIDTKFANTPLYGNGYEVGAGGKFGFRKMGKVLGSVRNIAARVGLKPVAQMARVGQRGMDAMDQANRNRLQNRAMGYGYGDATGGDLVDTGYLQSRAIEYPGSGSKRRSDYADEDEDY